MGKITKSREKLDSIRGEVISSTSRIDFILGYKLRTYFFPKTNNKTTIIFWNVINTPLLNFDKKTSLYETIPYFKKLKGHPRIKKSLRFVQKLRNIMAHWELDEKKSNFVSDGTRIVQIRDHRKVTKFRGDWFIYVRD